MNVEVVRDCLASSIVTLTYGGVARVVAENPRCRNDSPAICDNCCASETGNPHCECQECTEMVNTRLETLATAFVEESAEGQEGFCEVTTTDFINDTVVRLLFSVAASAWLSSCLQSLLACRFACGFTNARHRSAVCCHRRAFGR